MKINKLKKPKIMFAVVSEDTAGQTVELFRNKEQAEIFLKELQKRIESRF